MSFFQKELDEKKRAELSVHFKAFYAAYWLAKECTANKKARSMCKLIEYLGFHDMWHFQHRSSGIQCKILLTVGKAIQDEVTEAVKRAGTYGLLVDDATDILAKEQMLTFVQVYNSEKAEVVTHFLFIANTLKKHDAQTQLHCLKCCAVN